MGKFLSMYKDEIAFVRGPKADSWNLTPLLKKDAFKVFKVFPCRSRVEGD